ncbi:hypothetical protein SMD44_p10124 (plasmid) [Streptomyces alboflavus]|uniref:Uncharacterized protein n=1 Tax=Streptomyces alboflavus TaxID=67267 RepID=A0A291W3Z3_9ACTN|nr:DUF6082 family protein [Streptomyces alboflavus]ATM24623.1 hypothetical protein SMD44_p10124 [Streptomyces alboflavus]
MSYLRHPVLVLAATVAGAAALHGVQRHREHRNCLELEIHQAHVRILQVAAAHPHLDPIWERNFPKHVLQAESGPMLMCQMWVEHWRAGLNVGVYTAEQLRHNAASFMADPMGLKMWALTRHKRQQQARNRHDRRHVALLDDAYVTAGGPRKHADLDEL